MDETIQQFADDEKLRKERFKYYREKIPLLSMVYDFGKEAELTDEAILELMVIASMDYIQEAVGEMFAEDDE